MKFAPVHFDQYENTTGQTVILHDTLRLAPYVKIYHSDILGPIGIERHAQIGPNTTIGKYCGVGVDSFIARSTVGNHCAIGNRVAINPFNHPIDWLSVKEFQYHPKSHDWVAEYRDFVRLERSPDMFGHCEIGCDIWCANHVQVMADVNVGHGAVLGAGAVVTKDVPPYAIMAGVPAKLIRYRFSEKIVERLLKVRWWDFELCRLSGLNFRDVEGILPRLEDIRAELDSKPS